MSSIQGGILFENDGAMAINTGTPSNIRRHQFNTNQIGEVFIEATASPAATDPRAGGFAYTSTGALYCTTAAVGATSIVQGGVARTATGQLHVTFSAPSPSFYNGGLQVSGTGAVYVVGIPDFVLPLTDSGSGAVSTTLTSGTGSATFTRATEAATKLSTGLWKLDVASGVARSSYIGLTTAVGAYGGYLSEAAATQLCLDPRDMTTVNWVLGATMTRAKTSVGIDGVTSSAMRLTGGAVAGTNTILQTLVAAASSRTYSCWMKRVTGTGTILIQQGATTLDVTALINSATFTLVQLNTSTLNSEYGIQINTNADAIDVDCNQFEAGADATTPIPAAGTRNGDSLSYPYSVLASAPGTAYGEFTYFNATGILGTGVGLSTDVNNRIDISRTNSAATGRIVCLDASVSQANINTANSMTTNIPAKLSGSWATNSFNVCLNGGAVVNDSSGTVPAFTTVFVGVFFVNGTQQTMGMIKNVRLWRQQLPDNALSAMTA